MPALLGASLLAHAGLCSILDRKPPPLASIGADSISVDLVASLPAAVARQSREPSRFPDPEPGSQVGQSLPPTQSVPVPTPSRTEPVVASPRAGDVVPARPAPPVRRARSRPQEPAAPRPAAERQAVIAEHPAAMAPSEAGSGRAAAETDYRGLVFAHLAGYKRFPSDARSRGDHGEVKISFTLDGAGRVTSVMLVHGSGVAGLDQEAEAMVHRASPFPAPPGGQPASFTVPINFGLR